MQTFQDLLRVFTENERVLPSSTLHSVVQSRIFNSALGSKGFDFFKTKYEEKNIIKFIQSVLFKAYKDRGINSDFIYSESNEQTLLKFILVELLCSHLESLLSSSFGFVPMSTRNKKVLSISELKNYLSFIQRTLTHIEHSDFGQERDLLKKVKPNTAFKKLASLDLNQERLIGPIFFPHLEQTGSDKYHFSEDSYKRRSDTKIKGRKIGVHDENTKIREKIIEQDQSFFKLTHEFNRPSVNQRTFMRSPPRISRRYDQICVEDTKIEPKSYKTPPKENKKLLELSLSVIKSKNEAEDLSVSDLSSLANLVSKVCSNKVKKTKSQLKECNLTQIKLSPQKKTSNPTIWILMSILFGILISFLSC